MTNAILDLLVRALVEFVWKPIKAVLIWIVSTLYAWAQPVLDWAYSWLLIIVDSVWQFVAYYGREVMQLAIDKTDWLEPYVQDALNHIAAAYDQLAFTNKYVTWWGAGGIAGSLTFWFVIIVNIRAFRWAKSFVPTVGD